MSSVLKLLGEICLPLEVERVALGDARGRVLREAVCAAEDQPAFDRSAVDGFAVRLDDDGKLFRVVDEIRAGDWKPRLLQPGEVVRIATGGALPGSGLQVVMREDAGREGEFVSFLRRDGELNIRARGDDAREGQILVEPGIRLHPGALGLLASVGCARPLVTKLPRVLHLATGNEIVPVEAQPQRGQIRDSNSTLVRAFLNQWGIDPVQLRVAEDEASVLAALAGSAPDLDLILVSGGASVGQHDFTRQLLEQIGFSILISKTTARPGKPLIVARRGDTVAFGLPGNPLAHFVCLNLCVRVVLEALAGRSCGSLFQTGRLAVGLSANGHSRETFWPGHWQLRDGVAVLTPLRWSSSGDITSLASANALIRVVAEAEPLEFNRSVEFVSTELTA